MLPGAHAPGFMLPSASRTRHAVDCGILMDGLSPASAGCDRVCGCYLGLTPQALFYRPLRGLVTRFVVGILMGWAVARARAAIRVADVTWGLRPRLYAAVRCADSSCGVDEST